MKTGIVKRAAGWSLTSSKRSCYGAFCGARIGSLKEDYVQQGRFLSTSNGLWMFKDGFGGEGSVMRSLHRGQLRRASSVAGKILLGRHVKEALANGEPIVALESTVITHGLPEPENLELALSLEREIAEYFSYSSANNSSLSSQQTLLAPFTRQIGDNFAASPSAGKGTEKLSDEQFVHDYTAHSSSSSNESARSTRSGTVIPATVGIVRGQLIVGLSRGEIEYLAQRERSKPTKASRRDVPITMALGLSAGTTVSATMAIASSLRWQRDVKGQSSFYGYAAKVTEDDASSIHWTQRHPLIKVFATGGTGGVHLGGESSLDISADLYEFARSPMGVVASGFKSFLDTKRSLEYLETLGCTVASLALNDDDDDRAGERNLFPGFLTTSNRQKVSSPCVLDNIGQAARLLYQCLENPLSSRRALLLAVPIPRQFSLDDELHDEALQSIGRAVDERDDLAGKDKTPLILKRLNELTEGRSVRSNMELLKNNAKVGAQLAFEYALLSERTGAILGRDFADDATNKLNGKSNDSIPGKVTTNSGTVGSVISGLSEIVGRCCNGTTTTTTAAKATNLTASQTTTMTADDVEEEFAPVMPKNGGGGDGVVVVGCTMIDMHVSTKIDDQFKNHSGLLSGITFKGRPHLTLGGVGRNLATALEFLNHKPVFITSLADDNLASFAQSELRKVGFGKRLKVMSMSKLDSSCFALVLIDSIAGQCEYVIANLDAVKAIDTLAIEMNSELIKRAPLVVMDANLMDETIKHLIKLCSNLAVPIFLEPTDKLALPRLVDCFKQLKQTDPKCLNSLLCLSPNVIELMEILRLFGDKYVDTGNEWSTKDVEKAARQLLVDHLPQLKCLIVTMDKLGVLVAVRSEQEVDDVVLVERHSEPLQEQSIRIKAFQPPHVVEKPVSASGAGDSFAAGFISGLISGYNIKRSLSKGFAASRFALFDHDTISEKLRTIAK